MPAALQPPVEGPSLAATLNWIATQIPLGGESFTIHESTTTVGQYVNNSKTDDNQVQLSFSNFEGNLGGKTCTLGFQENFRGGTGSLNIGWDLSKMSSGASVTAYDNSKDYVGEPWNGTTVDTMGGTGGFTMTERTTIQGDRTVYLVEAEPPASRSGSGSVTGVSSFPDSNLSDLVFRDRELAERVASALDHAVQLCGGSPAAFQQQAMYPNWEDSGNEAQVAGQGSADHAGAAAQQEAAEEQANEATQKQQQIQDKIDSLNQDIETLENEKQNAEQLAQQDANYSNCSSGGYGTVAAIGAAGCRTADEVAEAKAKQEVNQDANKISDDRAKIASLQGQQVQEAPHRDASFAGALNQVAKQNGQTNIQDAANQQAANIIAVGAANDAARAQAVAQGAQRVAQEGANGAVPAQQATQQIHRRTQQAASSATAAPQAQAAAQATVAPTLPANCIAVSKSERNEANFGSWVFTNDCGMGVNIVLTGPPDPHVTGNSKEAYQNSWLAPGQSFQWLQTNEPYKYFACPSPWSPFDSATSSGNIVNPRYESAKTVCLQIDASGDIVSALN